MNRTFESVAEPAHTVTSRPAGETVDVRNLVIRGPAGRIPVRIYKPETAAGDLPIVVYFHGGGFISGSLDDADATARHIAGRSPALVMCVAYALAPARPFPAAPEDAYAAALWISRNAARFGADPDRLAVAGDDAGGNIAASLAMIARDRNELRIAAQVLIGPMLDPSMTRLGDAARLKSDITAQGCLDCYRQYLPDSRHRMHPYAAPLESRRLSGLPAAFIATAECDVLHNEAEKYAASLIAAGVHTQVARFAGITHSSLPQHPPLLNEIVEFLRRRLVAQRTSNASPELFHSPSKE